jgi:hypothetical protein
MILLGAVAATPSKAGIVPSLFRSKARPPAVKVSGPPAVRLTVSVLRGPKPSPTALIAIVAIPREAMEAATNGSHSFLLPLMPEP